MDFPLQQCTEKGSMNITSSEEYIYAYLNQSLLSDMNNTCLLNITVPRGFNIMAYAYFDNNTRQKCTTKTRIRMNDNPKFSYKNYNRIVRTYDIKGVVMCYDRLLYNRSLSADHFQDVQGTSPLVLTVSNVLFVFVENISKKTTFFLYFKATQQKLRQKIYVNPNISMGFLSTLGISLNKVYPIDLYQSFIFHTRPSFSYMLSFPFVQMFRYFYGDSICFVILHLYPITTSSRRVYYWSKCGTEDIHTELYSFSFVLELSGQISEE